MGNAADVDVYLVAVDNNLGYVLLLGGVSGVGGELLHGSATAVYGYTGILNVGNYVAANFTDIEFNIFHFLFLHFCFDCFVVTVLVQSQPRRACREDRCSLREAHHPHIQSHRPCIRSPSCPPSQALA